MSTFQSRFRLSDPVAVDRVPDADFEYITTRAKLSAFDAVHRELKRSNITQAQLAKRLGDMDTGQLSRLLAAPGNWTLPTITKLLWAISGARLIFSVEYPMKKSKRNDTRPHWEADLTTKNSSSLGVVSIHSSVGFDLRQ